MQTISDYFNHGFIIGRMSLNEARQWKYWAVSVVAIAIHYAILGGLDKTDAYNLSDAYIQTLDSLSSMQEALSYLQEKALELVRAMLPEAKTHFLPSTQSAVGSFIFTLKKIYSRVILNIEKGKARETAYPEYYSINLL
ncbi:hypothetical protein [Suilimivivens sp.]|uniref:hypothetical protein n=1 Tax=Suilimivivens sp. TaxID=2981669 RepID=UPI00307830C2